MTTTFETKDSGAREEFSTGSRRDTREGKGRFDLLPWSVIEVWAVHGSNAAFLMNARGFNGAIVFLTRYAESGDCHRFLPGALWCIGDLFYIDAEWLPTGNGYDNLPWHAIERWAQLLERGAKKYGERNWERGQPLSRYFDSAIRHLVKWKMRFEDEDHLAAALFNVAAIVWTQDQININALPKELNDLCQETYNAK